MKRTIKYLIAKLQTELSNEELNSLSIQDLCYALKKKVCFNGRTPKNNPDCASEVYNFFQPYDAHQAKNLIKSAAEIFKKELNTYPSNFLDVGSGLGHICEIANQLPFKPKTFGIELSPGLVRYARQISPNTKFFEKDILTYDKYNGYDIIWCFNPCNGGEIEVITKQIENPCIIISLNSDIRRNRAPGWTEMKIGWETIIKNF